MDTISRIVEPSDIDYVVVHHAEPGHSGCIREVVDASSAVLLGHPLAKSMLESFHGSRFKYQPVSDGSTLEIGSLKLRFHSYSLATLV